VPVAERHRPAPLGSGAYSNPSREGCRGMSADRDRLAWFVERLGLAVGVITEGEAHSFFYGSKGSDGSAALDENNIFEIGSITKNHNGAGRHASEE
jgi:CubicO group peptidase (beta-lactamase class C family)